MKCKLMIWIALVLVIFIQPASAKDSATGTEFEFQKELEGYKNKVDDLEKKFTPAYYKKVIQQGEALLAQLLINFSAFEKTATAIKAADIECQVYLEIPDTMMGKSNMLICRNQMKYLKGKLHNHAKRIDSDEIYAKKVKEEIIAATHSLKMRIFFDRSTNEMEKLTRKMNKAEIDINILQGHLIKNRALLDTSLNMTRKY